MSDYILELNNITKNFPGVKALDNANFRLKKKSIHALLGENGAGKSTLLKMLAKVESINGGEFILGDNVKTAYYSQHQLEILNYEDTCLLYTSDAADDP